MMPSSAPSPRTALSMLGCFLAALIWSGLNPNDRFTWFLEVISAVMGAAVLLATWRRFPLSNLTYLCILLQALVLVWGGKHAYALNPFFAWLQEALHLERSYHDRLRHFMQGFTPTLVAREMITAHGRPGQAGMDLLRGDPLLPGRERRLRVL